MLSYVLRSFLYWLIKKVSSIDHNIVMFYFKNISKKFIFGRKYSVCPVLAELSSEDKAKTLFTLGKLGSIK